MNSSQWTYAAWTDTELLDALRADEEKAFAEIYKRYCYRLFTVAYRKLNSRQVAEELVQDLFADLWGRRGIIQIQQLESYLFSAIRYRIINYIKSKKIKSGYELYCRLSASDADTDTEKLLAHNDLSEALLDSMRKLPEKSREIFQLSRLEHYTVPEISVRVKLSEKSVEYHLTKSLKLLRSYLRDYLMLVPILFLWLR
ncbi:RNA polymerase sigma-70 factor [Hymenobacter tibetensis]|uniref:RNA polymerase sigma-70 factor n=1 Tax=Hymenobacter tibetensis TaxID=497967 RepID=A0ABY4D2L1_9BACT|nr:RNA polymerase sigma-70 factor [Hymenobacter tibetensis]UOG76119.1 RNA polymerase sigma-70 factor [Hymenobacter tibetensis]